MKLVRGYMKSPVQIDPENIPLYFLKDAALGKITLTQLIVMTSVVAGTDIISEQHAVAVQGLAKLYLDEAEAKKALTFCVECLGALQLYYAMQAYRQDPTFDSLVHP